MIIKKFTLILLILISIVAVFINPGSREIENHYTNNNVNYHPSLMTLVTSFVVKFFPQSKDTNLFYQQNIWLPTKGLIYIFYLLTFVALILFSKYYPDKKRTLNKLDLALAFFASVSILVSSVALGNFEILALPFLIISILCLFRKLYLLSGLFLVLSLSFSWSVLIIVPIFIVTLLKNKLSKQNRYIGYLFFIVIPLLIILNIFRFHIIEVGKSTLFNSSSNVFSFPNLASMSYGFLQNINNTNSLISQSLYKIIAGSLVILGHIIPLGLLFKNLFGYPILISIIPLVIPFILPIRINFIYLIYLLLLYLSLLKLILKLKRITIFKFLNFSLFALLSFILFFPGINEGNLIFPVLISLMIFSVNPSASSLINLVAINIISFINLYFFNGLSGVPTLRGEYFELIKLTLSIMGIVYMVKILTSFYKFKNAPAARWTKKFIVIFLLVVNLSLLSGNGSPDTVSWSQYAYAATIYVNPFRAQTNVDQRYPPLSTVIMSVFANLWKNTIGFRPPTPLSELGSDYALSIKVSILFFYSLTIIAILQLVKFFKSSQKLKTLDILLIIFTTFSLIIQTQGLADVNIYTIPTLIASIILLYKRKYFLSGILLGITISIKWQPVILIPLFGLTLFNLRQMRLSLSRLLKFIAGFIPIPLIVWSLVVVQPGGVEAFNRSFDYLKNGAPMLSGQALNLNWVVTYLIHIFQPEKDVSLSHLSGLNRQIPTSVAPIIFQGYLFYFATFIIILIYWFFKKKNITNFLGASLMIFFSHFMLNKSSYEKHLFYVVIFSLLLYLIRPTKLNRWSLILFDIMTIMNLTFFYGFTGPKEINRLIFGFDITVLFSIYYFIIFLWVLVSYLKLKDVKKKISRLFDKGPRRTSFELGAGGER